MYLIKTWNGMYTFLIETTKEGEDLKCLHDLGLFN